MNKHLPRHRVEALCRLAREIAKCDCGGVLDFETNTFGGVVEICQSCRNVRPMQRAARVDLLPKDPVESRPCPENCGRVVVYKGRGRYRKRCIECQSERYKANATEQRKNEPKTKWKPTKGRAA